MTQCDKVLRHIRTFGSITTAEAFNEYAITRLPARIADLKDRGIRIKAETETGKNRFGDPTRYTRYSEESDEVSRA